MIFRKKLGKKRTMSLVLAAAMAVTTIAAGTTTAFASQESAGLYVKQMGKGYCTLASAVDMVRSKMYNEGNTSWPNVTQQKMKGTAWRNGLLHSFSYYGVNISYHSGGCNTSAALQNLLKEHPEGIEIYERGLPHAIFLTRYDASTDTFYVADPVYSGERTLAQSWLRKAGNGTQASIIRAIDCYWYVSGYNAQTVPGGQVGEVASSSVNPENVTEPVYQASTVKFNKVNDYSSVSYEDVDGSAWYAGSVKSAYEMGLMNGISWSEFSTDGNVSIAQAIVMAARIHSIYYNDGADFTAQDGEAWYMPYVRYALNNDMLASKYDSSQNTGLDYDQPALRVQFAEILNAALPDDQLTQIRAVSDISDVPRYSDEDRFDAVYNLYEAGILTGQGDTFGTWKTITRAEAAAIVSRVADASLRVS